MREILFKAKAKNWRELPKEEWWVEGDVIHEPYGVVIQYYVGKRRIKVVIDPQTLCQYTGMRDKNGERIWENDIVRCNRRGKEAKYKVVWDKTYADFRIEKLNGLGVIPICIEEGNVPVFGRHYERIGNIFDGEVLMVKKQKNLDECKVVGNVFDNKELLDEL